MYIDEQALLTLCNEWTFDKDVISKVLEVNMNDIDSTRMYLDFMEVEMADSPADAWEAWCSCYDMTDQLLNNPFIEGSI